MPVRKRQWTGKAHPVPTATALLPAMAAFQQWGPRVTRFPDFSREAKSVHFYMMSLSITSKHWLLIKKILNKTMSMSECSVTSFILTLCYPVDCSLSGPSVHGILQARILEWVVMPSLQMIFPTQGSNPHLLWLLNCRWIFHCWATREACKKQTKKPRMLQKSHIFMGVRQPFQMTGEDGPTLSSSGEPTPRTVCFPGH